MTDFSKHKIILDTNILAELLNKNIDDLDFYDRHYFTSSLRELSTFNKKNLEIEFSKRKFKKIIEEDSRDVALKKEKYSDYFILTQDKKLGLALKKMEREIFFYSNKKKIISY